MPATRKQSPRTTRHGDPHTLDTPQPSPADSSDRTRTVVESVLGRVTDQCGLRPPPTASRCTWPSCGHCAHSSAASSAADLAHPGITGGRPMGAPPRALMLHLCPEPGVGRRVGRAGRSAPAARGRPIERPRPELPRTCPATRPGVARPRPSRRPVVPLGPLDVAPRAVGRRSAAGRHRCRTAGSPPAPGRSGRPRSRTAVDRGRRRPG